MRKLAEIYWKKPVVINNEALSLDSGLDARLIHPGRFGSQYPRMLFRKNGVWMIVYTVYRNHGYLADPHGGNTLVVAISEDCGSSWREIAELSDPGRDLDNGQILELADGSLLLACRSVIWQQSYILPVYRSADNGMTWERISIIDENVGEKAGSLGNPDRGVYEPHMLLLDDGSVAVMYASEKYACSIPEYSQVISEKVSLDGGYTWGEELIAVRDLEKPRARPGMPVWDRCSDGSYVLCFEIIATEGGDVFLKRSADGVVWDNGLGQRVPMQKGGAFVLPLDENILLVTSNTHHVTFSSDGGRTWKVNPDSPWDTLWTEAIDNGAVCTVENGNVWPAMYRLNDHEIVYVTSVGRLDDGGNNIQFRIGELRYEQE